MPTPKMVRYHYRRLRRAWYQLQKALDDAHNADVIKYEKYQEQSPCQTNWETKTRINATTEKQLAEAFRDEILADLKKKKSALF